MKKIIAVCMLVCLLLEGCQYEYPKDSTDTDPEEDYQTELKEAQTTPYGRYSELITYTLATFKGDNNSNMPAGDTYEDNAYTRCLKEMLNIQNDDVFRSKSEEYFTGISMMASTGDLPDVMLVDLETLNMLVNSDSIADLTEAYQNCTSQRIKNIYASYGESFMDSVTFDNKIMALPGTNISDGPNLVWLRKDWMDKLGLSEPKTLDDVESIVKQFVQKDPGGNGNGNTVGLVCDTDLAGGCGYSSEYLMDIVFANYDSYPMQWIRNSEGDIVYGSVQPEVKSALEHLNLMYQKGLLDSKFLMRTTNNIIDLITSGKCGSFFGPWWSANNPLQDAVKENPDADWRPYLISTDADGSTSYHTQNPNGYYIVVRKGFQYPEIIFKMVSVMFDYIRNEDEDWEEFTNYYKTNVDPTARPLAINVDYNQALPICYERISKVLSGEEDAKDLPFLENAYYETCRSYLEHEDSYTPEEWSAYASRIMACSLLGSGKLEQVNSLFFGETETMSKCWWKLEEMEKEAFLKIVTGEKSSDYFDTFVEQWNNMGGEAITKEVRSAVSNGNNE